MTLEEKVGQLFLVFFKGPQVSDDLRQMINDYHIGGIVLFSSAGNIQNPAQVARLINDAQREATTHSAGVPLFVAIDQEGGPVVRLRDGATRFPSQMALGATGSEDLAREMARVTATELKALGINMNLAPVLDVNDHPENPVIGIRSLGSSPAEVARLGAAMIGEYAAMGVIATAKHFPGHGHTSVDSHISLPVVNRSPDEWQFTDLSPFQAAIDAGIDAIMTAHVVVPSLDDSPLPATLSPAILQGWLRERLGFNGLIVTDSMTMGAINQSYGAEAAALAFQAGADVLAFGADWDYTSAGQRAAYNHLLALVQSGEISTTRLDESVRRILTIKARYGLLNWQPVAIEQVQNGVSTPAHLAVAEEIARRSITLLRDDQGLLPLPREGSLLLIWPTAANDPLGSVRRYQPAAQRVWCSPDPTAEEIAQLVEQAASFDRVILGTLNAPAHPGQAQLAEALAGRALVVVALDKPYDLMHMPPGSACLATYGHVPVTLNALAQVLFGEIPAQGSLPVEMPN
jgi:beta-N-acetylhexosaminidase